MSPAKRIEFEATMSVAYHRLRYNFLERWTNILSVVTLISGTAFFTSVAPEGSYRGKAVAAIIVLIGIIQIVYKPETIAERHQQWLRRWQEILSEVEQLDASMPADIARWTKAKYEIESECVGEMRALQQHCHNLAVTKMSLVTTKVKLGWFKRATMQLVSWD